jgi:hypothetical protein
MCKSMRKMWSLMAAGLGCSFPGAQEIKVKLTPTLGSGGAVRGKQTFRMHGLLSASRSEPLRHTRWRISKATSFDLTTWLRTALTHAC